MSTRNLPTVLVAVDTPSVEEARALVERLRGAGVGYKIGLEFFSANGIAGVQRVLDGAPDTPFFLDLKFHDIPNTVAGAIRAVSAARPAIVNVHAAGGEAMMRAAVSAAREGALAVGAEPPLVIAVTILTSMDDADLVAVGQQPPVVEQVVRLAKLAQACGLDGVVCSAKELPAIRAACGNAFVTIVPGIRSTGGEIGDQKRVVTPAQAIADGATFLVIGRPITQAPDAKQAAIDIVASITR
ncbi:orotidine 5'-phosphate decarboxylase [Pavlovales sp. CCMP2436]|nr:orotidine 5'-phosphate decarboxylase [Pavlovales sp. CCMP2436]